MGVLTEYFDKFAGLLKDEADKVYEEPLLLDKKSDGTRIVHERTGILPGMDAVSYSAEKFDEKYGKKPIRTLDDYKADMAGIPVRRAELLQKAEKIFNEASEHGMAKGHLPSTSLASPTYLLDMQVKIGSIEYEDTSREVYEKIEDLRTQSLRLAEVEGAMGFRLYNIDKDVRGHGFKLETPVLQKDFF